MIVGGIRDGEKAVRFSLELCCSGCGRKVPGGMKASEAFYNSKEFAEAVEDFRREYLCGVCRDKRRTSRGS